MNIYKVKKQIHKKIDYLWKEGGMTRKDVYRMLTINTGGRPFHVSDLTEVEALLILEQLKSL